MPLDARIPLQAIGIQAPDVLGAMAQGQQYRQNQMAMQAAQATAQRNAMIQQRAAATNFADPDSVNEFARLGPETTPFIEAAGAGDTLFSNRASAARDATKFADERRVSMRDFLQREVGSFLNAPTDANIAASRARAIAQGIDAADFDAYAAPYLALPENARAERMRNDLGTTAEGRALVEMFAPKYDMQNAGGSIIPVQTNSLVPGATAPRPITVTPDPSKFNDVSTPEGLVRVYGDGRTQLLRGPAGDPLMPSPTPQQQQADAEAQAEEESKASARQDVSNTLDSMMGEYDTLYSLGAMVSTDRNAAENLGAAAGASLPGRVVGRALGSDAQTARDNIAAALPQIMLGLQTASGLSATQLNSNAELQFFKGVLGNADASYQTVVDAIARFRRFADSLLGGGGDTAPPTPRAPPRAGEVRSGYRFRGGDPANQSNWTRVQ